MHEYVRSGSQCACAKPHHPWLTTLPQQLSDFLQSPHGEFKKWQRVLKQLPSLATDHVSLGDTVKVARPSKPATPIGPYERSTEAITALA